MAGQCNATFDKLARSLGDFTCQDAPAFVHLRNPFALSNWTLPVLELMMVAGAVLALWYSIRRLRRDGDPTNLALWFATVIYLFVVEIPLYFPNIFGVEDALGVVFAHNAFTVQFLFDRLPLYIVALYPAVITLAYEIVRSLGVFRDRGIVVGAICVGFVHHCFYEVFDQLGPQLRWWAWNTDNPLNHPMLASVPMTSVFIFATLGPIVVTVLVMLLVGRKADEGTQFSGLSLTWRTVAAGALVPVGVAILSIPSSLFGGERSEHHRAGHRVLDRTRRRRGDRGASADPTMVTRPRCHGDTSQRVRSYLRSHLSGGACRPVGECTSGVLRRKTRHHRRRNSGREPGIRLGVLRPCGARRLQRQYDGQNETGCPRGRPRLAVADCGRGSI